MLGGSISRYHTPQTGSGLDEDLIKVAGPMVVGALQRGVEGVQRGVRERVAREGRRLKRKASTVQRKIYKRCRVPDIFG